MEICKVIASLWPSKMLICMFELTHFISLSFAPRGFTKIMVMRRSQTLYQCVGTGLSRCSSAMDPPPKLKMNSDTVTQCHHSSIYQSSKGLEETGCWRMVTRFYLKQKFTGQWFLQYIWPKWTTGRQRCHLLDKGEWFLHPRCVQYDMPKMVDSRCEHANLQIQQKTVCIQNQESSTFWPQMH